MSNPTSDLNKQDQNQSSNPQSQAKPAQRDPSFNQNSGAQKNDPSSSRVGNNAEKDEPAAQRNANGMKSEGKGQDNYSSADDKSQQAPRKSSNA